MQPLVAEIGWAHIIIMERCKNDAGADVAISNVKQ